MAETGETPGKMQSMVDRVMDVLKRSMQLGRKQADDTALGSIRKELLEGDGQGPGEEDYMLDDIDVLWNAPLEQAPKLAVPHVLVPRSFALVHSTYGHPGVATAMKLVSQKFSRATLTKEVREYVLSRGCRGRSRSASQRACYWQDSCALRRYWRWTSRTRG